MATKNYTPHRFMAMKPVVFGRTQLSSHNNSPNLYRTTTAPTFIAQHQFAIALITQQQCS
jgi:hypothetical protein